MPSTLAHRIFGERVLARLPEEEARPLLQWRDRYDLGLHGPDLLFYHKPLSRSAVGALGRGIHRQAGLDFFRPAGERLRDLGWPDKPWAYLAGYLCHFALDYSCHGYVDGQAALGGPGHDRIELELDRALAQCGRLEKSLFTGHIRPSRALAEDVLIFYPDLSLNDLETALGTMGWLAGVLAAPNALERFVIDLGLGLMGKRETLGNIVMPKHEDRRCRETTPWLLERMVWAEDLALRLILGFRDSIEGSRPFDEEYNYDFGSRLRLGEGGEGHGLQA